MTFEITRAAYERYALRLFIAFSGPGTPHSLVGWTKIKIYDSMMASGNMIVFLQMDSENSVGIMCYSPVD